MHVFRLQIAKSKAAPYTVLMGRLVWAFVYHMQQIRVSRVEFFFIIMGLLLKFINIY